MNILNILQRNRKRKIVAPYVRAASLEICTYLLSLKPGKLSDEEVQTGFRVFAHNRLFMPIEIAGDFRSLLQRSSNDNGEVAELAFHMKAYTKRY
jgi:hypothetical protein